MVYRKLTSAEQKTVKSVLNIYDIDIGKSTLWRNTLGYVNKTFLVDDGKKKFILRESHPSTSLKHLKLEVEVLDYLNDFDLTPHIIANSKGRPITIHKGRYYTLQTFMPGESRASWNNLANFNIKRSQSFFQTCARFTKVVQGFKKKIPRDNRPLFYYIKNGKKLFTNFLSKTPRSPGKKFLIANKDFVLPIIEECTRNLQKIGYDALPKQIVHFDSHPGNVNFVGNEVSGLFDFDWVRFDNRLSDLAATIGMCCYYYGGKRAGIFRKKHVQLGLRAYRRAYGQNELTPEQENKLLAVVLKAYMFFQFIWAVDWYKDNHKNKAAMTVLKQFFSAVKLNDYDQLFS